AVGAVVAARLPLHAALLSRQVHGHVVEGLGVVGPVHVGDGVVPRGHVGEQQGYGAVIAATGGRVARCVEGDGGGGGVREGDVHVLGGGTSGHGDGDVVVGARAQVGDGRLSRQVHGHVVEGLGVVGPVHVGNGVVPRGHVGEQQGYGAVIAATGGRVAR